LRNVVEISNSTLGVNTPSVMGNICGGYTENTNGPANAENNSVTITGSTVYNSVFGGSANSENGDVLAANNTVTIDGSQVVLRNVYAGYADSSLSNVTNTITASGNTLTISNASTMGGNVAGGYSWNFSGNAVASNNIMNISDSTVKHIAYGGYANGSNGETNVTNNTVTVTGGTMLQDVYAGYSAAYYDSNAMEYGSTATGNTLTINNGSTVAGNASSGYAWNISGTVVSSNNTMTVTDSTINGNAYSGWADSADSDVHNTITATGNTMTISNGTVGGNASSGYSLNLAGNAVSSDNTMTVTDSTVNGNVYGGHADSPNTYGGNSTVTGNILAISGGTVGTNVYGGYASNTTGHATTSGNSVTLDKAGIVNGSVYGGYAESPDPASGDALVTGNTLSINGAAVKTNVYGGYAVNTTGMAETSGNRVTIDNGGTVDGNVYGGYADSPDVYGGSATSMGNILTISRGSVVGTNVYGGYTFNTSGTAITSGNRVTIDGSTVNGNAYGGYADPSDITGDDTAATGNILSISNGSTVGVDVYGGYALDTDDTALASNNSVIISNSTAGGNVYGGYASNIDGISTATGNRVTIGGGTVNGNVYGGYAEVSTGTSTATNNIVTISGNSVFGPATGLFGGWTNNGDAFTGNTLNLYSPNVTVASLQNFEYLNFFLPSAMGNAGVMLNVNGTADITGAVVNVGVDGASSPLKAGDHVVLISAQSLAGTPVNSTANGQGMQGVTLRYEFDIEENANNELWAILRKTSINPATKALSEGFLSGTSLLYQSGDLIAGHGMSNAVNAAMETSHRGNGMFFDISGGWSRYNTGSHAEMSSLSLITGLSKFINLDSGNLVLGAFFDYGNGSYDTFNSFSNASVLGNGNVHHLGGGILGRMDFRNHFYADASFRAGQVNNGYYNGDLLDPLGRAASYDSSSAYYGMHVGGGKILNLSKNSTLDLYGKYFWTKQQGDAVTLSSGDPVDFQSVNSHRTRFGARFSSGVNKDLKPYFGAAWEHEFDGAARAMTNGYAIGVPSLRGDTGVGELGVTWKPTAYRGFFVDLGAQGYVGKREGATASLAIARIF